MPNRHEILTTLDRYKTTWCRPDVLYPSRIGSEELDILTPFGEFVAANPGCFERANTAGHFTGSALVVNPSLTKVLLTHHRKLDMWLQLGGHADGVPRLHEVAMTEANEESGLTDLSLLSYEADTFGPDFKTDIPLPFDLDWHGIPARASEPAHIHYDVRYVVLAKSEAPPQVSHESHDVRWMTLDEARALTSERSMHRQFAKIDWLRQKLLN